MKKIMMLFMIMVLSIGLVACKTEAPIDNTPDPVVEEPVDEPVVEEPTIPNESKEVTLYFANEEYIQTGNESLEKMIPEKRTIDIKDISIEEAVIKELMNGPKSDGVRTVIPATAKILGVEVTDGTAFVDFAQEGLNGGSLEETFTINQIVASFIELDTVDRVQFLIDGEISESLMGHYSIDKPFEKPLS